MLNSIMELLTSPAVVPPNPVAVQTIAKAITLDPNSEQIAADNQAQ